MPITVPYLLTLDAQGTPTARYLHDKGHRETPASLLRLDQALSRIALALGRPVVGKKVVTRLYDPRADEVRVLVRAGFDSPADANRAVNVLLEVIGAVLGNGSVSHGSATATPEETLA